MHASFKSFMSLRLQAHLSLIIFPIASFSHYCIPSYLIGCVLHLLFFFLSHLLLVLFHLFSILSGDPPKFITWSIVTSFPLFIPQALI